jgi:NAD(P)-dependent dehydrogenase (short-subunit alcohol dehydrogenase family)
MISTDQKHIVVIGGTHGTGKVIVAEMAKTKARLSVVGRKQISDQNRENLHYYFADLTDSEKIPVILKEIVKTSGKITHLIFCQRFRGDGDKWQGELDTGLNVTKNVIDLTVDKFDKNPDRSIVIIGSVVGSLIAYEQSLGYHVAKAGLRQLVRYYAVYLGKLGIRINSVSPATVLKADAKDYYRIHKKLHDVYKETIPLGRMGTSEDISNMVSFLCSSAASYITGQDMVVDGGLSLLAHEGLIRKLMSVNE